MSAMKALAMREQEEFPLDFFSLNLEEYSMQCEGLPELSLGIHIPQNELPIGWLADCSDRCPDLSADRADDVSPKALSTFRQVEEAFAKANVLTGGGEPTTPGNSSRSTSGYTSPNKSSMFTPSVSPFASHPSSPNALVGSQQRNKDTPPKQKIPRHKRKSHIDAEQRRKCKIQNAFDELKTMIPAISDTSQKGSRLSKSAMLSKTVEFCRELREDNKQLQREANKLKQEMQALTAEITTYQSQLPAEGIETIDPTSSSPDKVKAMYEDYVKAKSLANWKFWIFGLVIRPLFGTYNQMISTSSETEFCHSVMNWVQEKLALVSLRPALLNTLRYISRHTSVMSSPEKFPQEATQAAINATINADLDGESQNMELS